METFKLFLSVFGIMLPIVLLTGVLVVLLLRLRSKTVRKRERGRVM